MSWDRTRYKKVQVESKINEKEKALLNPFPDVVENYHG